MAPIKTPILYTSWFNKPEHPAGKERMPHPAVQIYIWICLALIAQVLIAYALVLLAGMLVVFSFSICAPRFLSMLRRTRWIFFSLFLIYAYTSSGEALWPYWGVFSPVADGVVDGFFQILRLITVLAGLSILLTLLSQSQLIAGLYTLSRGLSFLGLSHERFAVRLALTLRYAESAMQDTACNRRSSIEYLLAPVPVEPGFIDLHMVHFTRLDWLLVAAATVALLGIWL